MTDPAQNPESDADAKPRTFTVWTGKRHVFRVKPAEIYFISAAVKLIGDVPAVNHEVRLIDPDTGEAVGDILETDDEGVLRAEVPENKAYHIELVDSEPELESASPEQFVDDEHAVLRCQFVHASGEPLTEAEIHAKLGETEMVLTTDEDGRIETPAHLGDYELSYGEQVFHAHSLPSSELDHEYAVYHFVVEESESETEGGEAGGESGSSPEDHFQRHELDPMDHEPQHDEEWA